MSFFGGNPFASAVGQKIEQATDASLASENWALNMEICDIINDTEDGPKDAVKAIRKRLQQNAGKNYTVVMYTLTVLETCVKNCGRRFHLLICNKEFVQELVKLIGPKNDPPTAVQEKVLSLIQSWADAFRLKTELSGVVQVYHDLKQKGIEFPMTDLDTMAPIHTPQRSIPDSVDHVGTLGGGGIGGGGGGGGAGGGTTSPAPGATASPLPAPASPAHSTPALSAQLTPDQLAKLQSELDVVQGNMAVLSEMLSELTPGKEHPSDLELLQELHSTCRAMQQRLVELIGKLSNDEITAELLRINDELNNVFLRYSRFENNREGQKTPSAAISAVTQPESLIDLSDGASNTSDLNTQLSGLALGAAAATTASAQLSMLSSVTAHQGSHKDKEKDKEDSEFDMFAQSRNVTYESSKNGLSSYQANLEPEQVSGGLGALAQNRGQPVEDLIQMHYESDFDEMAAWLDERTVAEGSEAPPEESLTSHEFERFLAERAAAAEALPTLTTTASPSATTTSVTVNRQHKQINKDAESESSLFAL